MSYKILIDPHSVLMPVQKWIQDRYDVTFLNIAEVIIQYSNQPSVDFYEGNKDIVFSNQFVTGFPSWFREEINTLESITKESIDKQMKAYGPTIKALDLCFQHESISLILLWNDVTAFTKSLTFLGKKYGIPFLHVSHGIPAGVAVHGKIWADKYAVFGKSSRQLYLDSGNSEEKIVITGNPYWDDWGPCAKSEQVSTKSTLGVSQNKKIIMYAPTWYHNLDAAGNCDSLVKRDLLMMINAIRDLDRNNEIELVVKIHTGQENRAVFYSQELEKENFSHKIITNTSPLQIIQVSDVVICTGSMVVEALLVGKPVIFSTFEQYSSKAQFNYLYSHHFTTDNAPFYISFTQEDLSQYLIKTLKGHSDFSPEAIKEVLMRMNGPCDGKATERVAKLAMEMAKNEEAEKFISPVSYKKSETYYANVREDIPSMITGNPQNILEVGCADGAMGEFIKNRCQCEYVGVEINPEVAQAAQKRLDRVIVADVEKEDFFNYQFREGEFDYIIYGDVLEHLYDPWTVIYKHKKFLKEGGYIIASIPNVRNLGIIESLINGNWTYKDEGILDSTHLRFFTLQEIKKMFSKSGYKILEIKNLASSLADIEKIKGNVNVDMPKLTIKNISKEEMLELSTVQFVIKAQKPIVPESAITKPKTSIIIVTYNSIIDVRKCLESVLLNTSGLYEVIVVDNASKDGIKDYLADLGRQYPQVKAILNTTNNGFSKGCNQGIEVANGEYIVLLNPDTVVSPSWNSHLIDHFVEGVGAVGPVSNYVAGRQKIELYTQRNLSGQVNLKELSDDLYEKNRAKSVETKLLIGFCMIFPRQMIDEVGMLDEELFLGNDDLDLSLRFRNNGYKLLVATDTFVYHKGQASFQTEPSEKTKKLVQESTDALYRKLARHYGPDNIPSSKELWDMEWFLPSEEVKKELANSSIAHRAEQEDESYRRIQSILDKGLYDSARLNLEKLLQIHPDHALAHNDLGVIYLNKGDEEKAQYHYEQATVLQPENVTFQKNLADFYFMVLKRLEDALAIYQNILTVNPRDVETLFAVAQVCVSLGKKDDAEIFYKKILEIDKDNTVGLAGLEELGKTQRERGEVVLANNDKKIEKSEEDTSAYTKDLFSIVILTFNQLEFTKECVKSIQKHTPEDHEIIFVDNASADGTKKWLKKIAKANPNYHLVENRENLGFAKGCNQGIEKSSGEYILLLNNDVIVTEEWLSGLLECLAARPDVGIVGPMTNNISGPQKLPSVGYDSLDDIEKYAMSFRRKNRHRLIASRRIVGFCMLFRHELADEVGGLDESFGSGNFEDDDYCLRVELAGYKNFIVGDVFVHHFGSVTFIGNKIDYGSSISGNRKIFDQKWSGIDIKSPLGGKILLLNALEKADSLYQKDLVDAAVDVLFKTISHAPDDQRAYYSLAEIFLSTKRYDEALSVLDKMPEQHKDLKYKELQAYFKERLGADNEAMICADAILQVNPESATVLNVKGLLASKKGDTEAAEDFWEKAITADPSYGYSYTNLGLLRREQGKDQEALHFLQKGAILSPLVLETVNNYLEAASDAGAIEKAEHFLQEAVSLHPVNKCLRYSYIDILLKQNKYDEAKKQTEEAKALFGSETNIGSQSVQSGEEGFDWRTEKVELKPIDNGITISLIVNVISEFDVVRRCIPSFEKHTGVPFELILIVDSSSKKIKDRFKRISANAVNLQIIKVKKGASLGHCYNAGLKESRGYFCVFCHGDVVFPNGWYDSFSKSLHSVENVGIVGPLSNNVEGLQRYRGVSVVLFDQFVGLAQKIQENYRYRRISKNKLSSFCIMCHRGLFENVGSFDEDFLMEDFMMEDFCRRISIAGKENLIVADVLLYHFDNHKNKLKGEKKTRAFKADKMAYVEKWGTVKLDSPLGNRLLLLKSLDKAQELEYEGEIEKAASQLLKTIAHAPNDKAAYLALAELFFQANQHDEALAVLGKFPEVNDPKCIELIGYCMEGKGNVEEAEKYADKALIINSKSPQALNLKGVCLYKNGKKSESEEYFKKTIEFDPGYGEPYTNIGLLKWEVAPDECALDYLEKGFALSPHLIDNATTYHSAITALALFDRADSFFRDAVALYPHNKRLVFLHIDILLKLNKYKEAMHEIENAIVRFGVDDGLIPAALNVRDILGPKEIDSERQKRKTISLCIITKNEEKHIANCLKSVNSTVDEMIVVDTGSQDRTKEIAKAFGAKVFDSEWKDDFSEARNVSLVKANGDWILVLDADEVVSVKDYELLHELVEKGTSKAYIVLTRNYVKGVAAEGWVSNNGQYPKEETGAGWYPSEKVRLFQSDVNVRFENPVHELVEPALERNGIKFVNCDLVVHHYGRFDENKVSDKGEKYYQLGIKKLKEQGESLKALHELAVQAGELGRYEEAIELWKKVLKLVPQDASRAFLNMGYAYMQLEKHEASILASKQALETDPNLKEAALNYATCNVLIGEIQKVIVFLEGFLSKGDFYPSAMGILAAAYCIDNQHEKGRKLFTKVRCQGFNINPFIEFLIEKLDVLGKKEIADKLRNATLDFL